MGCSIGYDLIESNPKNIVTILDKDIDNILKFSRTLKSGRPFRPVKSDISDTDELYNLMKRHDVAIGASCYSDNPRLTELAISTNTHFCDLGGNNTVVEQQFSLDEKAKEAGVKVIPACGVAPGAVNIIAKRGIELSKDPSYVAIKVGGLPQHPQGILNYMKVFSINGLVNECHEPVEIRENGKIKTVQPMTEIQEVQFPEPFGTLEAALTSGGCATLTRTLDERIRNIDYKTLRYPGHWEQMNLLRELGFFSEKYRKMTEELLETATTYEDRDALLLRVTVGKQWENVELTLIDLQSDIHTAMQRTTGYSASIIAQMMASGEISNNGVLTQEKNVPAQRFIDEWSKREINLEIKRNKF